MAAVIEDRVKEALRQKLAERDLGAVLPPPTPEPEAALPKAPKKKDIMLKDGQVLFSKLFGKVPSGLCDFGVTVLDKAKLPEQVAAFVPKNDPDYVAQLAECHALLFAWELNDKTLITGPTGSGKSSGVQHCCALTNRPMVRINNTGDMESSVLFGSLVVEAGSTVWKDGPVTEAVRYGAVLVMDEWDVCPPEILFGLQYLLEQDGKLYLKEKPGSSDDKLIEPHPSFRLVACGNTQGQGDDSGRYAGTNVQNNASIDRFGTTIVLDYLDAKHEQAILANKCKELPAPFIAQMVQLANLIRTACKQNQINLTMSPRTLINWGQKAIMLGDASVALRRAFADKLRDSDRKIVSEFYSKVFGKTL